MEKMMRLARACCAVLLLTPALCVAQPSSRRAQSGDVLQPAAATDAALIRPGHAAAMIGSGRASEGGHMRGRAMQLSFGQNVADRVRCDATYINEGHPTNQHRDGFAATCWWMQPLSSAIRMEAGFGPYFSMNTTTPAGGSQINDKRLGLVASAALLYRYGAADTFIRLQYNRAAMPGAPSSDAIMLGLGTDLGGKNGMTMAGGGATELGLWGGAARTATGDSPPGLAGQAEARRFVSAALAYSVGAVSEARTNGVLNRHGVALQAWWVRSAGERWRLAAGAGPLFARDSNLTGEGDKVLGLISLEAAREIVPGTTLSLRFARVASSYDKDADLFLLGVTHRY